MNPLKTQNGVIYRIPNEGIEAYYFRDTTHEPRSKIGRLFRSVFSAVGKAMPFAFFKRRKIELKKLDAAAGPNFFEVDFDASHQIIYNKLSKTFTLISPAPPIKNLAISGGGAKGVILPGVIQAFEQHKTANVTFREQLENISGSSVGAITASLIAVGMPADHLVEVMRTTDFKKLLGKGMGPVGLDGKPLVDFIRNHMRDSIKGNLMRLLGTDDLRTIKREQIAEKTSHIAFEKREEVISGVMEAIHEVTKSEGQAAVITFSMLHQLHKLEPKVFKDLVVTATCKDNGQLCYFDAERTPKLDIAIGCRASGSLPIFLSHVHIDSDLLCPGYADMLPGKKSLSFVDGGYLDNIPVSALENKQTGKIGRGEYGQNLQTLALVFDTTRRSEETQSPFFDVKIDKNALFNPKNWVERVLRDLLPRNIGRINTQERNTVATAKGYEEIRVKYAQRTIPLLISMTAVDFKLAKKHEEMYLKRGYQQAMDYLQLHQDEMIHRTFDTLEELKEYLPKTTKS